jgi:hypothetical protein
MEMGVSEQRCSVSVLRRSIARAQLAAVAMAIAIAACASNAPRSPQHLSVTQVGQVAEICEEVMGLEPSEPLVDNLWPGDPDPDSVTNNYRGCIASLSSSLEGVPAAWGERLALDQCRAGGLEPGTSELGTCVLRTVEATSASVAAETAFLVVTSFGDTPEAASSSASLSGRRERLACAEIGLEPSQRAYESCVSGLRDVLSANEMSALYRNP